MSKSKNESWFSLFFFNCEFSFGVLLICLFNSKSDKFFVFLNQVSNYAVFLSNYAKDNNLYSIGIDCDIIKNLLQKDFWALTKWFC